MSDTKNQNRLLWDAQDALEAAKSMHGDVHCRGCDSELDAIHQTYKNDFARMEWELKSFAKRLQRKKLERGCLGCHPPNYGDWGCTE